MTNTEELPPYPTRPHQGTAESPEDFEIRRLEWRDGLEAYHDAKDARALAAGRAVYDRLVDVEDLVRTIGKTKVRITTSDFRDFRAWFVSIGGAHFELSTSMEFEWFRGDVLVVVR